MFHIKYLIKFDKYVYNHYVSGILIQMIVTDESKSIGTTVISCATVTITSIVDVVILVIVATSVGVTTGIVILQPTYQHTYNIINYSTYQLTKQLTNQQFYSINWNIIIYYDSCTSINTCYLQEFNCNVVTVCSTNISNNCTDITITGSSSWDFTLTNNCCFISN